MNPDIESLMSQYLDGRVSAKEAADLAKILSGDPKAAERFAELTRMDEGLRVALKSESRSELFAARLRAKAEPVTVKRLPDRRRWMAAAAGLAVLGSTAWWFSRDGTVPTLVMDWAKSRVNRPGNEELSKAIAEAARGGERPVDEVAELRRKLRGFAIPFLQMRSMALTDALNTLNRQWTDLPHQNPKDAQKVKMDITASARKLWPTREEEPVVTLDIPGISLHTALNLIAAQAGLSVVVGSDSVMLEPATESSGAETKEKTWTFPLAKPTVDSFLASLAPKQEIPVLRTLVAGADSTQYNFWGSQQPRAAALTQWGRVTPQPAVAGINLSSFNARLAENVQSGVFTSPQAVTSDLTPGAPAEVVNYDLSYVTQTGQAHTAAGVDAAVADGATVSTDALQGTVVDGLQSGVEVSVRLEPQSDGQPMVTPGQGAEPGEAITFLAGGAASAETATYDTGVQFGTALFRTRQSNLQELAGGALPQADSQGGTSSQIAKVEVLNEYDFTSTNISGAPGAGPARAPVLLNFQAAGNSPAQAQPWYFIANPAPTVSATLPAWLGTFGLTGETLNHDTENGVLSVTGNSNSLRVAGAAVAALAESSQWGVSMETRVLDLGDLPPPDFQRGQGFGSIDSTEVEEICKKAATHPGASCRRLPAVTGFRDRAVKFSIHKGISRSSILARDLTRDTMSTVAGVGASTGEAEAESSLTASKSGEQWSLSMELKDGEANLSPRGEVMDGAWAVIEGQTPGRLYLVRVRSATVAP